MNRWHRAASLLLVLGLFCSGAASARAQSCTAILGSCTVSSASVRVSITIGRAVQLGVSPSSTALSVPTPADYNTGYAATNGPTVTVRANANWTLSVSSATALWSATNTGSEPARTNKPASDLRWALSAGGTFTGLSTSPATIASGSRTAGTPVTLFYRTNYSWLLDTPGNYSLPVVFTIVAP